MTRILTIIAAAIIFMTAEAETFSYRFSDTPLSKAIQKIIEDHPGLDVNFIYNELEDYHSSSTVNADNAYQALRQTIGQNPVSVIKSGNSYYIEALRHGRHIFTGKVVDQDSEPVIAATVLLLAPNDSTIITYGITDNAGRFSIPCDRKSVLARLSCIGYNTSYLTFDSPSAGIITMRLNPIKLNETVVRADELMVDQDKIMVNVTKNQQKHSYDGYTLLNVAMIPGLDVNPFDHTVASEGQSVLLCINGMEATAAEVMTLNPRDVTRIDFYTGYDPRHPDSRYTIDFIVKVRDHGGTVVLSAQNNLNTPTGSYLADWRMHHYNTEFGVRLQENYNNYAAGKKEYEYATMAFEKGDVTIEDIRYIDRNRNHALKVHPYLVFRKSNDKLKLSFTLQQQRSRHNDTDYENFTRDADIRDTKAETHNHSDRLLPSVNGNYQHKFGTSSYLNIFFNGNYSHTENSRDYRSLEHVLSRTLENFYGTSASAQYSFGYTNTHKGFITAGGRINHSKIRYSECRSDLTGESSSLSRLTTGILRLYAGDNWKVKSGLSLNLILGAEIANTDNDNNAISTQCSFIPEFRLYWQIARGNTLNYSFNVSSSRPPMSYYSPDEKWIMQYLRLVGNPDLKMSRKINTRLSYRNVKDWGYLELSGSYSSTSRAVYWDFRCDNSRDVYIQTFRNGGTCHHGSLSPRFQLKIVPNHLILRVGGEWNYMRTVTYKPLHRHTFSSDLRVMFMAGGFSANMICSTPVRMLNNLGAIDYVPWSLQVSADYVINNWNIGLTVRNPFMTAPSYSEARLPGITELHKSYNSRILYDMVVLTAGYRFSYGKPHKKYEEVEHPEVENSAILGF